MRWAPKRSWTGPGLGPGHVGAVPTPTTTAANARRRGTAAVVAALSTELAEALPRSVSAMARTILETIGDKAQRKGVCKTNEMVAVFKRLQCLRTFGSLISQPLRLSSKRRGEPLTVWKPAQDEALAIECEVADQVRLTRCLFDLQHPTFSSCPR